MNITEIQQANAAAGYHFFEPGTLRFFASRISSQTFGRYFVTSEQFRGLRSPDGPRLYSVRHLNENGSVDTIGEFQQYETLSGAVKAARRAHLAEA